MERERGDGGNRPVGSPTVAGHGPIKNILPSSLCMFSWGLVYFRPIYNWETKGQDSPTALLHTHVDITRPAYLGPDFGHGPIKTYKPCGISE